MTSIRRLWPQICILGCFVASVTHQGCRPGQAATLSGMIRRSVGGESNGYYGPVVITPLSTPLSDSPDLVVGGASTNWTSVDGALIVTLRAGLYRFQVRPDSAFLVDVPDGTNTYALLDRITNAITYTSTYAPGGLVSNATASVPGLVQTYSTSAAPVAWTTNDTASLAAALLPGIGIGVATITVTNVVSAPATPTGAGVLYVESGALKYRGPSGTITTLALP